MPIRASKYFMLRKAAFAICVAGSAALPGVPFAETRSHAPESDRGCLADHTLAECDAQWNAMMHASRRPDREVRAAAVAARNEVTKDLADPESARFRNVRAFEMKPGGGIIFCGEINAKNRMGGYTGYRPFVALGDASVIAGADPEPELAAIENAMVLNDCAVKPLISYGKVSF